MKRSRPATNASKAIVARQPICGRASEVFAYEILYRHDSLEKAGVTDGDQATADVFVNALLEIGLDQLVGMKRAFLNVTRQFLVSDYCCMLPRNRVVLEVLEDIEPDRSLISVLTKLSRNGYTIALDDFHYSEDKRPLLALADYVKIDFRAETPSTLVQQIEFLKEFKVKMLAEKVETQEEFELAKELGFDYFQGYFFCRPKIVGTERIPVNRLTALRLIVRLQEPDLSAKELETLISQDLVVSFKLLRYLNSAAVSLTFSIDSVAHAAQMVGIRRIRALASTIMLTAVEDKPRELTVTAMVRATMAEKLAKALKLPKPDACFTVGLFSAVDALLDVPISRALELIPLSDEVRDALIYHQGPMGRILRCILAYENGNWSEARCVNLAMETISVCYLDSLTDARNFFSVLS